MSTFHLQLVREKQLAVSSTSNMSNKNDGQARKPYRRPHPSKRRLKTVVRDVNGSSSMFRHFYQSGGRDYEQYRLWLKTIAKSEPLPASSESLIDLDTIKEEPMDMSSNVVSILPPYAPPVASEERVSMPMIAYRSRQTFSPPASSSQRPSSVSSQPDTSPECKSHSLCDYTPRLTAANSGSLSEWTTADVGRFLEKHFPEKSIARKFIQQKIDGRTLPLLTEDHLMKIFKMKLGPALQLLALISSMRSQN